MTLFVLALLLMHGSVDAQEKSVSQLIKAELQEVDRSSKLVVFNNKRYKYEPDLKNAAYQYEDAEKMVGIYDLTVGENYFFNLYQSDSNRSNEFKLIFIAQEPQAE
jgi:hypothetical protein